MSEGLGMGPPSELPDIIGRPPGAAIVMMVDWFFENFEDPAENTPVDSGEYVYIWGGPETTEDIMQEAFANIDEDIIAAAVAAIEADHPGWEWVPASRRIMEEDKFEPWEPRVWAYEESAREEEMRELYNEILDTRVEARRKDDAVKVAQDAPHDGGGSA